MIVAEFPQTFEGWRAEARRFLAQNIDPNLIEWNAAEPSLFTVAASDDESGPPQATSKFTVPKEFLTLAQAVAYARDLDRWTLLYRIIYRLQQEPDLMMIRVDPDVHRARALEKSVRRDIHKMHAFVRFKKVIAANGGEIYVAWHRPEHLTLKPGAPFFARRFGDRPWSIFTPDQSAHWDLHQLTFGAGMEQHEFQVRDDWDEIWKTYYKSIFNPARIKIKAMKTEMAPKYWSSMPETALIRELVREAPQRLQAMAQNKRTAADVNAHQSLSDLRGMAAACTACPLFAPATQTVFGEGPETAELMIVGEQPGDQEDVEGRPFVGPAGEVLDDALVAAGTVRGKVYLTNAVKHFKFTLRGKRRLHQKPNGAEMHACKPWLEAEIAKIRPRVILALGATAGTAVLGRLPKISTERGRAIRGLGSAPTVIVSWHPAAILRTENVTERAERLRQLTDDIQLAVLHSRDSI